MRRQKQKDTSPPATAPAYKKMGAGKSDLLQQLHDRGVVVINF